VDRLRHVTTVAAWTTLCVFSGMEARRARAGADRPDPQPAAAERIEADWLRQAALRPEGPTVGKQVRPESDALGGCDGVKNGYWGFHTEEELNPWWQVDLGRSLPIDRVLLFDRFDGAAARTMPLLVLLSGDGTRFQRAYQHDSRSFHGLPDRQPLVVPLGGKTARYVRVQLPGEGCLHLDDVEVYAVGDNRNLALGRPATQSSSSAWSVDHLMARSGLGAASVAKAVGRGLRLCDDLKRHGLAVDDEAQRLREIQGKAGRLKAGADPRAWQRLYLDACWCSRRLALRNPLLDFEAILFAKSAPGRFPHMSDQFYGWWSRPGGGIFVLEGFKSPRPRLRSLTSGMPEGSFLRPDLSYDGRKALFAYCRYHKEVADLADKADKANVPEDAFYHIYEARLDGGGRRQLTHGRYDDFDARYLPNGEIVFLSTRKGRFLQCDAANTAATLAADLPDSYVRCGGDNYRPVPVYTLHAMDAEGRRLRPISAFENFEWTPAVAHDGRILYSRWDYIDRYSNPHVSLWSTNTDGSNAQLIYGNYTWRPQIVYEARPIPDSAKLVFTASAHHSIVGGSLVLLDRGRGTEGDPPIVRLTPEVPFPEVEATIDCYYADPFPLSEQHYVVGWADRRLPPHCRVDDPQRNPVNAMGLYLYDAYGNLNLLYRDPEISSGSPIPVRARPRPAAYAGAFAEHASPEGRFLVRDVYQGLAGIPRGSIKRLRVVAVPPKVQPDKDRPNIGVSTEDPGKYLLGTVPVEPDGSAYFRAPSGIPVFFQALDAEGLALQTMRSLTYAGRGQTVACLGCHESRDTAPSQTGKYPLAALRSPSPLTAGPQGTWPLRYDRLVQPVLDRHCTGCHRTGGENAKAAALDLTAPKSYDRLLSYGGNDLARLASEHERSLPGDCPARKSKLWALLTQAQGHAGVRLDPESLQRLATWMDLYAQRQGHFSDRQELELQQLRTRSAPLLTP
jgi:hypothetical protein